MPALALRSLPCFSFALPLVAGLFCLLLAAAPALAGQGDATTSHEAEGDLFLTGKQVTVSHDIDGDLKATGETVVIEDDVDISGDVWITAREAAVEGEIAGDLTVRAEDALINAEIAGDATFHGARLSLGPDAEIGGKLTYFAAASANIDRSAEVDGGIEPHVAGQTAVAGATADDRTFWEKRKDRWEDRIERRTERDWDMHPVGHEMTVTTAIFFTLIASAFAWLVPSGMLSLRDSLQGSPGECGLYGILWIFGVPVAAVVFTVTIIGIPVAVLLVILWALSFLVGQLAIILAGGAALAKRLHLDLATLTGRIIAIAITAVILWGAVSIPLLGGIIWFAAMVLGIGAIVVSARRHYSF